MTDRMNISTFRTRFERLTENWFWEVQGFIDTKNYVHPIDTDTKVLSTVFERLASPVIRTIALETGYDVEVSNQTTYPDFTLTQSAGFGLIADRIAIDIKTTYLQSEMLITLGGYNSFLQTETKNILYPYSSYSRHWVIGFIYERLPIHAPYTLDEMPRPGDVACPYKIKMT